MNSSLLLYYLILLTPRLYIQWKDAPFTGWKKNILLSCLELALLFLLFPMKMWLSLALSVTLYHIFLFLSEKRKRLFLYRFLQFIFILLTGFILMGIPGQNAVYSRAILSLAAGLLSGNIYLNHLTAETLDTGLIYLFGLVALVNELNHLIRFVLANIKAEPVIKGDGPKEKDEPELNRGKIIGLIERILFFFFVLTGNYSSIGFILTAKGITRFQELNDKNFAEYVLIGTLLSSSLSIMWSFLISGIL